MNNNTNENIEQVPVNSGNTIPVNNNPQDLNNNQVVQPVNVVANQNNTPSEQGNITSNSQSNQSIPTSSQEYRVNLVSQPAIQSVVPNNNVSETVNEQTEVLENVQAQSEKGSVGKTIFLILLFGGLLVMIIFLPDISNYIEMQKYLKDNPPEKITTGTLACVYENSSESLDYTYALDFSFTDSKLKKLDYILEIRGDANLDSSELEKQKVECDNLALVSKTINGVTVSCSLSSGLYTQRQVITYSSINKDEVVAAYAEAGGVYPDYQSDQNIDEIEKMMNASNYTCERVK